MEIFRFAHPEYFWGLWLIPLFTLLFIWSRYRRRAALKKFAFPETLALLMPNASGSRPVFKFVILMAALALFVSGLAAISKCSRAELASPRSRKIFPHATRVRAA